MVDRRVGIASAENPGGALLAVRMIDQNLTSSVARTLRGSP
jgi:hypothetical protein